ncbi:MAG TPA: hypothetical protein DDX70_10125 [Bacteroides sp.]|nr:MAG TPA: Protein of unknown function (DUF2577) [Caudoviricetes sp.]HBH93541.1 hypothetical protein [Bacteroides sp.]
MSTGWRLNCGEASLLSDYGDLLGVIKRSALEAMEASQPVRIYYGSVIGTEPLRILVDQRLTLGAAQVVLTRNVTDYEVRVTKDDEDGTTDTDTVIVHNALKIGENVILCRQQGGQKFVVLERMVGI